MTRQEILTFLKDFAAERFQEGDYVEAILAIADFAGQVHAYSTARGFGEAFDATAERSFRGASDTMNAALETINGSIRLQ